MGKKKKKYKDLHNSCLALVGHTCNPSYSGGIDQESHSLKLTQAVQETLSQKKTQKGLKWPKGIGPEFKLQYQRQKGQVLVVYTNNPKLRGKLRSGLWVLGWLGRKVHKTPLKSIKAGSKVEGGPNNVYM
jgi:hypothetical protein